MLSGSRWKSQTSRPLAALSSILNQTERGGGLRQPLTSPQQATVRKRKLRHLAAQSGEHLFPACAPVRGSNSRAQVAFAANFSVRLRGGGGGGGQARRFPTLETHPNIHMVNESKQRKQWRTHAEQRLWHLSPGNWSFVWYSPKLHALTPSSAGGMGLQHSKAVRSTRSLNAH